MSSHVLQCPLCSQPFKVLPDQTGQAVQCPTCQQTVRIPTHLESPAPDPPSIPPTAIPEAINCPACSGQFAILPDMFGQQVKCPHCQSAVLIQTETQTLSHSDLNADPNNSFPVNTGISQVVEPESDNSDTVSSDQPDSDLEDVSHLLPPKFGVLDPRLHSFRSRQSPNHKVILPDGKGGLSSVDDRIVTITHKGQEIKLISLPPDQLRRKRQIQNTVYIVIACIILAIVFVLLRKTA